MVSKLGYDLFHCVSRYWVSIGELLERVRGGGEWWPWTVDHVLTGDMERSYLAHLLEVDSHLSALGGQESILVLHVSCCVGQISSL